MAHKHLFRVSLFVLFAIAAFAGCKKDPLGSVSGTLTVYDPSTPLVKTPLASIKVYLINMNFKADTVNPENNRAALIDSTYTDAAGKYTFTAISEGKYSVVPVPGKVSYRFLPDSPGEDPSFSITADGTAREINFTAPIPDSNNDDSMFHMTIKLLNRKWSDEIGLCRKEWLGPFAMNYFVTFIDGDEYLFEEEYGWTCGIYTRTNNFGFFTIKWKDGYKVPDVIYHFRWELWDMPHTVTVTYDYATNKITRI